MFVAKHDKIWKATIYNLSNFLIHIRRQVRQEQQDEIATVRQLFDVIEIQSRKGRMRPTNSLFCTFISSIPMNYSHLFPMSRKQGARGIFHNCLKPWHRRRSLALSYERSRFHRNRTDVLSSTHLWRSLGPSVHSLVWVASTGCTIRSIPLNNSIIPPVARSAKQGRIIQNLAQALKVKDLSINQKKFAPSTRNKGEFFRGIGLMT